MAWQDVALLVVLLDLGYRVIRDTIRGIRAVLSAPDPVGQPSLHVPPVSFPRAVAAHPPPGVATHGADRRDPQRR